MDFRTSLALALVALIFPTAFSAPALTSQKRTSCPTPTCKNQGHQRVQYSQDSSYTYGFETELITKVVGTSDEENKVSVSGQAVLSAQSPCDYFLTIEQISVSSPSGQDVTRAQEAQGTSVRFTMEDGVVENLCVSDDDPTWSANLKRALVSMFVNSNEGTTVETDVSGQCPTTYSVSGDTYTKTRDLNACTHRDGGFTVFHGVPYDVNSERNSFPFVNSDQMCTQQVSGKIIKSVTCSEEHKLVPLSRGESSAQTIVKSTLTHESTKQGLTRGNVDNAVQSSIFFDYSEVEVAQRQKSSASHAVDLLNKICSEISSGPTAKVPGLFLQLKKVVRFARKDDLKLMYDQISSGRMCSASAQRLEKLYLEATAMAGTDGPIAFIAEIIERGASDDLQMTFNIHTTFANRPGHLALAGIERLVSKDDAESQHLLTASGLAHQYCKMTNPDCGSNNDYVSLANQIARHVKQTHSDETHAEKTITALQALGNLDFLPSEAVKAILRVLADPNSTDRVKVRALDAFRRHPCNDLLKSKAIEFFADKTESSEVRIQAYLASAKCLRQRDIDTVQKILDKEQSNQVGSFVASHIENMIESSSPTRSTSTHRFSQLNIPKRFPSDARKFSRNMEFSIFSPKSNLGFSVDNNLIFSQHSYIPRIASTNLTVDAFGRSYNVFEMGVYAKNFEHMVEKYFGTAGKLRSKSFSEMLTTSKQEFSNLVHNRIRRSVSSDELNQNELEAIQEKTHIEDRFGRNGLGDVYIRVYGTSILAKTFNTKDFGKYLLKSSNSEESFDLTDPLVFIDDELVLPTLAGLPLNLAIEGTAIVSMNLQGNLNLKQLLRGSGVTDMRAKVMPSAATVIKAKMSVGSGILESGLQIEGKISTSAAVDVKIVRENGKFELRFNMPQERMQIVDVRSDMYWMEHADNVEKKTQVVTTKGQKALLDNICTQSILGMKMCADVKHPTRSQGLPYFPLDGNSVASLTLEKTDTSMEGYYVKVERSGGSSGQDIEFEVVVDTPGSRVNRKISALANMKLGEKSHLKVDVNSPWKKLGFEANLVDTRNEDSITVKLTDDSQVYMGKAQVMRQDNGDGVVDYSPIIQYTLAQRSPVTLLDGKVTKTADKKLVINLRSGGPIKTLHGRISGIISRNKYTYEEREFAVQNLEMSLEEFGKVLLDGTFSKKRDVFSTDFTTKYGSTAQNSLSLATTFGIPSDGKKIFTAKTRSNIRSFLNFDLDWAYTRRSHSAENLFKFSHQDKASMSQKTVLEWKDRVGNHQQFDLQNELEIIAQQYNVNIQARANAQVIPHESRSGDFMIKAGDGMTAELKFESGKKAGVEYSLDGMLEYSGKKYELSEVCKRLEKDKWSYKTHIKKTPGYFYDVDTELTLKTDRHDGEHRLDISVTSDQWSHPVELRSAFINKPEFYDALLKYDAEGQNYIELTSTLRGTRVGSLNGKAFVYKYLDAHLKESHLKNTAQLELEATWLPTSRKVSIVTGLKRDGDLYNVESNLKWDALRDDTQHLLIKSTTTLTPAQWLLDTKNDITVRGDLYKLNGNGHLARDWFNGEHTAAASFFHSGKTWEVSADANLASRSKSHNNKLTLKLNMPNKTPYILEIDNQCTNIDSREGTFDMKSNIELKGDKNLNIAAEVGSGLPGNFRSYSGKLDITGNVLKEAVSVQGKTDMKAGYWDVSLSGSKETRQGKMEVKIDMDRWSPRKTLAVTYKLSTPFVMVKNLDGNFKYQVYYEGLNNIDFSEIASVKYNDKPEYKWETIVKVLEKEFDVKFDMTEGSSNLGALELSGKAARKAFEGKMTASLKGKVTKFNVEYDHVNQNALHFKLNGETPYEKLKNVDFRLTHKILHEGESFETEVYGKIPDHRAEITNTLEVFRHRKSFAIQVALDDQPARSLRWQMDEANNGKYSMESMVRWGNDKDHASARGNFHKSDETLDVDVSLDSPAFSVDNWALKATKKLRDGRHTLTLSVEGNNDKLASIDLDYSKKEARSGDEKTYAGSIKVDTSLQNYKADGSFELEDFVLHRQRNDGEEGRQVSGSAKLTFIGKQGVKTPKIPLKFSFNAKKSSKEKHLDASYCNENTKDCISGDVHLMHTHQHNGDMSYNLRMVTEITEDGKKMSTDGLTIKTSRSHEGREFDHTVELIMNQEKDKQIGYRVYRSQGKEIGAEILLPQRTIAAVATGETKNNDWNLELAFYVDKTKQPTRKVALMVKSKDESTRTPENTWGRSAEIVFKHPEMDRDLRVKSVYKFGGERTLLDAETVIDIFKKDHEITLAAKVTKDLAARSSEGDFYNAVASIKSKQDINVEAQAQLKRTSEEFHILNKVSYENRQRETKTSKIEMTMAKKTFKFEVDSPNGVVASIVSQCNSESDSNKYGVKYEVFLPGMDDTRVLTSDLETNFPPKFYVKVYSAGTPDEYLDAKIAIESRKLVAGAYSHDPSKKTLADLEISLNAENILLVKSDWNVDNMKEVADKAVARLERTGQNLRDLGMDNGEEIVKEVEHMVANMKSSSPSFEQVVAKAKQQWKDLVAELERDPDTKEIMRSVEAFVKIIRNQMGVLSDMINVFISSAMKSLDDFQQVMKEWNEKWNELLSRAPISVQQIKDLWNKFVEAIENYSRDVMRSLWQMYRRVIESSPKIIESFDWLFKISEEVANVARKYLKSALAQLSDLWQTVRDISNDVIESEFVRNIINSVVARYNQLMAELMDDIKEQLENWRQYVMKIFPEGDARDIVKSIVEYLEKKFKQISIDDNKALQEIYNKIVAAAKKIYGEGFKFDISPGNLYASIPLPSPVEVLSDLGKLFQVSIRIPEAPQFNIPSVHYGLRESWNKLRNGASFDEIIPPFKAYGLIIGSQYFRTFDGKFYHFEGTCQYLLTSDFVDGNFSIVAAYDDNNREAVKKSFIVTDHNDTVTFRPDHTILVNGQQNSIDAPVFVGDLTIQRRGKWVIVTSTEGLGAGCSMLDDVCAIKLDGFYHGKTAGLLGTYNHERFDEFTTVDGKVIETPDSSFTNSWKLDETCQDKPVPEHSSQVDYTTRQNCAAAFDAKRSPLRPCVGVVDPSDYKTICENLTNERGYTNQRAVCTSAQAYSAACYFQHARVDTLPECK